MDLCWIGYAGYESSSFYICNYILCFYANFPAIHSFVIHNLDKQAPFLFRNAPRIRTSAWEKKQYLSNSLRATSRTITVIFQAWLIISPCLFLCLQTGMYSPTESCIPQMLFLYRRFSLLVSLFLFIIPFSLCLSLSTFPLLSLFYILIVYQNMKFWPTKVWPAHRSGDIELYNPLLHIALYNAPAYRRASIIISFLYMDK